MSNQFPDGVYTATSCKYPADQQQHGKGRERPVAQVDDGDARRTKPLDLTRQRIATEQQVRLLAA